MQYKLYTFTGLTCCDGTTKSITLHDVIKNHSELFIPEDIPLRCNNSWYTYSYAVNTLQLYEDKLFCLNADYFNCFFGFKMIWDEKLGPEMILFSINSHTSLPDKRDDANTW